MGGAHDKGPRSCWLRGPRRTHKRVTSKDVSQPSVETRVWLAGKRDQIRSDDLPLVLFSASTLCSPSSRCSLCALRIAGDRFSIGERLMWRSKMASQCQLYWEMRASRRVGQDACAYEARVRFPPFIATHAAE